jgi:DNA-binding response OmpR family regulator
MERDDRPVVLVAEDERDLAELFATVLDDQFDVRVAHDGAEAVAAFDEAVDVALVDRRMPERSGDEVLAHIRDHESDCAVAMVTAVDPGPDIVDMPFDDYVTKPLRATEEVVPLVERMLRRKRLDHELRRHFRVASKLAVLEAELSTAALDDSAEYDRLRSELDALDADLADAVGTMDAAEVGRLLAAGEGAR